MSIIIIIVIVIMIMIMIVVICLRDISSLMWHISLIIGH